MTKFQKLKLKLLQSKKLYKDEDFKQGDFDQEGIEWKRASDIAIEKKLKPFLVLEDSDPKDVFQGRLGNCWFISALVCFSQNKEFFDKVVLKDQSFEMGDYAGIFHFSFWRYGQTKDVIIDDFLPVLIGTNELYYCSNKKQPNEFWAPLLEKAYAKLYESYNSLEAGSETEAFLDLTGWIPENLKFQEYFKSNNKGVEDLWKFMVKLRRFGSPICSSILDLKHDPPNGLFIKHGYSIIEFVEIKDLKFIKCRNPHGVSQYNGPWSIQSKEWIDSADEYKNELKYNEINGGEFWIPWDEFIKYFDFISFCYYTPKALNEGEEINSEYKLIKPFHGEWSINDGSASGSKKCYDCSYIKLESRNPFKCGQLNCYWSNPRHEFELKSKSNVVLSLIQKNSRERKFNNDNRNLKNKIEFTIYKQHSELPIVSSGEHITSYVITKRFFLDEGNYIIMPTCEFAGMQGEYFIRVFIEVEINHV